MSTVLSTDELENELSDISDIDDYIVKNSDEMINIKLSDYLKKLIESSKMKTADVISGSNLNRIYAYQILEGGKNPSRDKLIAFSFGLKLGFAEVQKLLKIAGLRPLYARDERDAAIIFAVKKGYDLIKTNELLEDRGFKIIE